MKLAQYLAVVFVIALLVPRPAHAADAPPCKPAGATIPVRIEGCIIEQAGGFLRARGSVLLLAGNRRLTAHEVKYDWTTDRADLKKATFTTCTRPDPDYRLEADSIAFLVPNRIRARRVSLFVGKTRIIRLPAINMRVGGRRVATDVFPRPSYDKDGGIGLSQRILFLDTDRTFGLAFLRFSSKNGFEGDFDGSVGFDGTLTPSPEQPLSFPAFRADAMAIPTPVQTLYGADVGDPTHLRGFLRVSSHLRTYNARDENLLVYRRPEVGLDYTPRPIIAGRYCPDARLPVSPLVRASWGRFSEVGGSGWDNRAAYGLVVPINLTSVGPGTVIQPAFEFNQSHYDSGTTYTWGAASVGVSHIRPNGTLQALRYIKRAQRGTTPFRFDRQFVLDEIQAAAQFQRKNSTLAFAVGYDLGTGSVYDWSALIGHSTDCLGFSLSWSRLEEKIAFGVQILR